MGSKHYATRASSSDRDTEFSEIISRLFSEGDSAGGIVEVMASGVLSGMGDPVFWKIKSALASAIMSMPAATGFEYGLGFRSAAMKGSEASDSIVKDSSGELRTEKNLSGGILGGITTGSDIVVRCAFKPTSSIRKPALTVDLDTMGPGSISVIGRHDPVVAVRGVAVAEAMVALVLADYYLYEGILPSSRVPRSSATEMEERWKAYMKEYAQ
jgi:chorismate synthase